MKLLLSTKFGEDIEPHLPPDVTVVHVDQDGVCAGDPSDAEAFARFWISREAFDRVLDATPRLRWVHTPSAGVDHVLTPKLLARDITLTNSAGIHAIPIAEFVLAFMLDRVKRLPELHAAQQAQQWREELAIHELYDATLLIIGLGGIGLAIAQRAAAFGMRVWGSRRNPQPVPHVERVVGAAEWRTLLPDADYVVIAAPLTPETRRMINTAALRAMRSDAYLINIARGAIIDEAALLTALREQWIAGAALDAFETEPLPADSPFWSLPNAFITPHCTWASPHMRRRAANLFLDNLQRYRSGLPLRNVVDKQHGY